MIDRLVSFGTADGGYGSIALAGGRAAAWVGQGEHRVEISGGVVRPGDGALRVTGEGDGDLVLGVSAVTSPLGFSTPSGSSVEIQALQVSGEHPALEGLEGPGVSWSFDFDRAEPAAMRCLWASSPRGLLIGFALRAPEASDHGAEEIGFARIARNGAVTAFDGPLLSTEYGGGGDQRRATLELWPQEGAAERGGGTRADGGRGELPGATLEAARFLWRISGEAALGGYDIVHG